MILKIPVMVYVSLIACMGWRAAAHFTIPEAEDLSAESKENSRRAHLT